MPSAKSDDLIDAYIEGLLAGITKGKPAAAAKKRVAAKKPAAAKKPTASKKKASSPEPIVTVDEDPKNDTDPKPKRSQKKAAVVEEKATTPKKSRAVKKPAENVISGGTSDNQVIKVEIQGVKMEFALKPNQGLAEAKVVDATAKPATPKPKNKKKTIPKNVRIDSWNYWIGKANGESKCLCCGIRDIGQNNFECGHIVSEAKGGAATITNLKPICSTCNKSMGTRNMDDFKAEHYPSVGGGKKAVEKVVKPKAEKKPRKSAAEVKREKQITQLLIQHDLKLCPGKKEEYININSILKSSKCREDEMHNFQRHCNRCGHHYHNGLGGKICPCQELN